MVPTQANKVQTLSAHLYYLSLFWVRNGVWWRCRLPASNVKPMEKVDCAVLFCFSDTQNILGIHMKRIAGGLWGSTKLFRWNLPNTCLLNFELVLKWVPNEPSNVVSVWNAYSALLCDMVLCVMVNQPQKKKKSCEIFWHLQSAWVSSDIFSYIS